MLVPSSVCLWPLTFVVCSSFPVVISSYLKKKEEKEQKDYTKNKSTNRFDSIKAIIT